MQFLSIPTYVKGFSKKTYYFWLHIIAFFLTYTYHTLLCYINTSDYRSVHALLMLYGQYGTVLPFDAPIHAI